MMLTFYRFSKFLDSYLCCRLLLSLSFLSHFQLVKKCCFEGLRVSVEFLSGSAVDLQHSARYFAFHFVSQFDQQRSFCSFKERFLTCSQMMKWRTSLAA